MSTSDVRRVPAMATALALLFATASPALADGASWTSLSAKEGGESLDQVTVKGTIADAASLPEGVSVTLRFGEHAQTLPAGDLVRTTKKITWKAAPGATGVQSFTLTLKSGKFTAKAKGIELGDLGEDVAFSIDVGGRSISTRHGLTGKGAKRSWKKGQPVRSVLTVQVMEVTHALGNVLLRPAQGTLTGGGGAPGVTVLAADAAVSRTGTLTAEIEVTDQAALGDIDMSAVFGAVSGFTDPGFARVTAGDDGEAQGVVFIERERGSSATVPPAGITIDAPGADGAPSGTLTVPAGAVSTDLPGVRFTPLGLGVLLPAPLPDEFTYVAGADLSAGSDREFAAANAPTMTLSRPSWADREPLAESDLRLLWWDGDGWTEQAGEAAYDEGTDRIGPSETSPARIPATGVSVYAAKQAGSSAAKPAPAPKRRVRGTVADKDGAPLRSQVVLTRSGAMVTGADGSFEVPVSALSGDSLEVVQAIGGGSSISRTVTGEEAEDGGVDVVSSRSLQPGRSLGLITGTIVEAGGVTPSPGATATVRLAVAVRGVELDTGMFPDDFGDDVLRVADLSDLGVEEFRWSLRLPGDPEEFESSAKGRELGVFALLLEAQDGGRTVVDGAYTVRVAYDVPVLGELSLYAGFRRTSDGLGVGITDVQLPAAVESTKELTATANAAGAFLMSLESVRGIPMTLTCTSADGGRTDVQAFQFASNLSFSVVLPFGEEVEPPAGLVRGQFAPRASMNVPRERFGYAELGGKIYVAGGRNGTQLASVEAFDPAANAWSFVQPLPTAREGCGLAAADGRLYAVGGYDGTDLLSRVDVYDPATNQWTAGVPLPAPREDAKVAVLDGKMYACSGVTTRTAGGDLDGGVTSVVVFDFATGTWSAGPAMLNGGVRGGGAAVLRGKLYVRGDSKGHYEHFQELDVAGAAWRALRQVHNLGRIRSSPIAVLDGEVFCLAGYDPWPGAIATSYSPVLDDEFYMLVSPPARTHSGAAAAGGVLYHFGGFDGTTARAETDAFLPPDRPRTDMPSPRSWVAAAETGGMIYLAGGGDDSTSYSTTWRYDPSRDIWRTRSSMATPREEHGMAAVDGVVYAVGGVTRPGETVLSSVEAYDPGTDAWTSRPPMSKPRRGHCVVSLLGKVYAIGGPDASVESYDPLTNSWLARAPMSARRAYAAAAVAGGRIYVFGGNDGVEAFNTVESYDPGTNTWSPRATMIGFPQAPPVYPDGTRAATIGTRIYTMGGDNPITPYGNALMEIYRFDAPSNSWAAAPFTVRGMREGAAVPWRNAILYFGGRSTDVSAENGPKPPLVLSRVFSYRPE